MDESPKITARFNWQIGPAFLMAVLNVLVGAFWAGAIYFKVSQNITDSETWHQQEIALHREFTDHFSKLDNVVVQVQAEYDAMRDRLSRVENRQDQSGIK